MKMPFTKYRPTRTPIAGGKYSETLGTGVTLFGIWREHDENITLVVDAREDIEVGDIIQVSEEDEV